MATGRAVPKSCTEGENRLGGGGGRVGGRPVKPWGMGAGRQRNLPDKAGLPRSKLSRAAAPSSGATYSCLMGVPRARLTCFTYVYNFPIVRSWACYLSSLTLNFCNCEEGLISIYFRIT